MATLIAPNRLSGLKQAAYVMDCITTDQTKDQIAIALGGDTQLVAMWVLFLEHNHWIVQDSNGWTVTPKGAMWSKNIADRKDTT